MKLPEGWAFLDVQRVDLYKFLIREDAALLARAVDLDPGAC